MAVLLLSLIAVCSARGQASSITVQVSLDQEQFLPYEEIRVAVRIVNLSGQTLELGKDNSWLSFHVESRDKFFIERYGEPDVTGVFTLESSMAATKRANITPHFNVYRPGHYTVSAKVRIPEWNIEVSSRPISFNIVRGTKLREIQFGVPAIGEERGAPEIRKYILQQAEYRKEMKLYIRLTDANEVKTIKLYPIARMMSFSRPEVQVDRFSNLHVLHQSGQHMFTYCTMNPYGQILTLHRYDILGATKPRLTVDESGRISVRDGSRVYTDSDLPPVDVPTEANAQ
ncbi:MAG: hypothetical protein ACK4UN_02565 [Limisphaerales bacterium]